MNRAEILHVLLFGEDHEKLIEAAAWARGRGHDNEADTQKYLVSKLLGDRARDEIVGAPSDQSIADDVFAKGLQEALARFDHPKAHLIKWWTCLAIIDLGVRSDGVLQQLTPAAETTLEEMVTGAKNAFAKGDGTTGLEYTLYELCIVSDTIRAVAHFRSPAAVKYLNAVCRGGALKGRQPLMRVLAMCALGAIGTEDAKAALAGSHFGMSPELDSKVAAELDSKVAMVMAVFGQRTYDEFCKLTSSPPSTPNQTSRYCTNCGSRLVSPARFCTTCGQAVKQTSAGG